MKNKYYKRALYALIATVFIAGLYIVIRGSVLFPGEYTAPPVHSPETYTVQTPQPDRSTLIEAASTSMPAPTSTPRITFDIPIKIYFTRQEVSTDIIVVGVNEDNTMEAPDDAMLGGWLKYSVPPGEPGNSIIAGHDSAGGVKGVFSILKKLELGDAVVIEHADGVFNYFEVADINTYLVQDVPDEVMQRTREGEPQLTLITCLGDYDITGYSKSRVIVTCNLADNT